jgi:hypothetical protein
VQATVRLLLGRRRAQEGNSLLHKKQAPKRAATLRTACLRSASLSFLLPCDPSLATSTTIAMSSLPLPRRFQSEAQLNSVRRLLGWTAPALAGKIRAGKIPLRDLAAGEFVLFNSYIMCGLVPPISSFFLLLLEEFGLQL